MDLRKKQRQLASNHRTVKYNFILTELDLALTFCEMSIASDDKAKSERNAENAQRAYNAALHFLQEKGFSSEMRLNVRRKVFKLKSRLKAMNARPPQLAPAKVP